MRMTHFKNTLKLMTLVLLAQLVWAMIILVSPIEIHISMLSMIYIMGVVFSLLAFLDYKDKMKHEVLFFILILILNYFAISEVMVVLGS